jgi:hypothetical protein
MKLFLFHILLIFILTQIPAQAELIGHWKLDGNFNDSSGNDNNGELFGGATYSDSVPDTLGNGQSVAFDGTVGTYGSINHGEGGIAITTVPSYTVSMWVQADGTIDNADDRIFSEAISTDNNPLFNMGTKDNGADGTVDLYVRNGAQTGHLFSNGEAFDDTWHHVAWVDNDGILDLYIDGVFDKQFDHSVIEAFTPDTTTIGGILRGTDCCNFTGNIDDLAIWDEALSENDIAALASGAMSPGGPSEDDDEDGLPDAWEEKLVDNLEDLNGLGAGPGPGSGTGDFDGDGLTDLDEYEETKTDPTKADTDGDELEDGVETDTGTYVSATNTGTDPRDADTDGDGLTDGVETNTGILVDNDDTGTDPNNADTDGDGFNDNTEISQGTDPTNKNDFPQLGQTILFIGGQADAAQGADGTVMSFLEERYGSQNITYKQANQTIAGEEADYALLIISSTPGSGDIRNKFHNSTTPIVNWEEAIADNGGGEFQVTAGRTKDNVAEDHVITIVEDHPIVAGFNVGDDVTISTGQTEVWWSTDQQAPGSLSLAAEKEDPSRLFLTIVDEGEELNDGSTSPAKRIMLGITDSTFNNFTEDGKTLIGQSIDWALGIAGGIASLEFTEIIYDAEEDTFRFKWNSKGGKTYSLYYSEDMTEFDADLDDSIESGGDFTVYPAEGEPGLENPLGGVDKIFFKVMENED